MPDPNLIDREGHEYEKGWDGQYHSKHGIFGDQKNTNWLGQPNVEHDILGRPKEATGFFGEQKKSSDGVGLFVPHMPSGGGDTDEAIAAIAIWLTEIVIWLVIIAVILAIWIVANFVKSALHDRKAGELSGATVMWGLGTLLIVGAVASVAISSQSHGSGSGPYDPSDYSSTNHSSTNSSTTNSADHGYAEDVTATADGLNSITVTWLAVGDATGYHIHNDSSLPDTDVPAGTTQYVLNGVDSGTNVCLTVVAMFDDGTTTDSESSCATTTAAPELEPPTGLSAQAIDQSSISVTWDDLSDETGYSLYNDWTSGSVELPADQTSYTLSDINPDSQVCFTISAERDGETSDQSDSVCASTVAGALAAPTDVTAQAVDQTTIDVYWDDTSDETGYHLRGSDDSVDVTLDADTTSDEVDNLSPGTKYCFTVAAVQNDQESPRSDRACATTAAPELEPPTGLSAQAIDQSSISVTWDDLSDETGYSLYNDWTSDSVELPADQTSYTLSDINPDSQVCFTISAERDGETSDQSDSVCASTLPDDTQTTDVTVNAVDDSTYATDVSEGETVSITARGQWCMGGSECGNANGIRWANEDESGVVLPSAEIGALIGRIDGGDWFLIGRSSTFNADASGELDLAFNDRADDYGDNSGYITATIVASP